MKTGKALSFAGAGVIRRNTLKTGILAAYVRRNKKPPRAADAAMQTVFHRPLPEGKNQPASARNDQERK
jgi:hypothetical protein